MGIPSALAIDTDLDMVKTPGFYFCNGAENENRPDDSGSFSLLVEKTGAWEGKGVKQTYTGFSTGITYTRVFQGYDETTWEEWKQLATATPPEEYDIPFRSGWQANGMKATYCKSQEGICIVNCAVHGTGTASENFIATLPSGFRPSATFGCAAHAYKGGVRGIAEAQINAYGDIAIHSPIEFDYVSFSCAFVAGN